MATDSQEVTPPVCEKEASSNAGEPQGEDATLDDVHNLNITDSVSSMEDIVLDNVDATTKSSSQFHYQIQQQ